MHPLDCFPRHVPVDEDGFDWRPQEDVARYTHGHNGDFLVTPFQCDLCIFWNLHKRNPIATPQDDLLLCCIRRINLDAMWRRESAMVASKVRGARQMVTMWHQVGLTPVFPPIGPYPVSDLFGYRGAIVMVLKSLDPGRYA
jgi:hypothetical protein